MGFIFEHQLYYIVYFNMSKYWVEKSELAEEIRISQKNGLLTNEAAKMLLKMATGIQSKYTYKFQYMKEDAYSYAIEAFMLSWHKADYTRVGELFSWFTTVISNGFHLYMRDRARANKKATDSLDEIFQNDY